MRYFIELSYNGEHYHGWQMQPDAISVQQVLEETISTYFRTDIKVVGAGRTDTGVHAKQLYAHLDLDQALPDNILYRLNSFLPADIVIHSIFSVKDDAHARFDAVERTYEYHISLKKNPFILDLAHTLRVAPNIDLMNTAAEALLHYKDFQCFSKTHTNVKTYNCSIKKAIWQQQGDLLVFTISADRFLRNMVRAIVGTLLDVGKGKITLDDFHQIIQNKNRSEAGTSAPAKGLYLTKVEYPNSILNI